MMLFSHEYCWVLTFLVLQMWNIGCKVQGYSMNAPSVTAQDGLCAYISCTFTKPSDVSIDKCLWYRINPGAAKEIVASTKNNPSSRIFFTGDVNKGDCSLIINDVEKNDEANYQFRLEAVKPKDNFNYGTTPKVTVTDLKEKPEISVGTLVAGKEATVTCRSPGVCAGTAPGFTWTGQYGESLNYNNSYSNLTSIYFSNFTFTPARIDNGKSLECKVAFLSNTAVTQQTIKLNVEYPPDVIITFKGGLGDNTFIVKEGDSAQINCTVDSNPIAEITWFMGNDKKEAMNRQWIIYNLTNVTLNDAGKYSCTGKNNLGSSEKNIDITVYYAPRTPNINCATTQDCSIGEEHMVYIMEDTTSTLVCTAKSLPEASLSWIVSGSNNTKYFAAHGLLTFDKIALSNAGQLTCVARNIYGISNSSIIIKVTTQPRSDSGIIIAVTCVVVIVLLLIAGTLVMYYFRKKKLSKKSEDKKEMNADDSSVIYANSEVHIYGNQTQETGTNSVYSVPEDNNTSEYMNFDDIHYATIDFSKLKRTNAPKGTEINYAEIKK
ncbi:sialic acid-binding Ig-like lectin 13 isoform X1 [Dendrobates tinctorius]|uniref:sialic acid-binding Ig-like lectin 13 isoform X1 n=1 Tax=Dendrobates tinctorius TaxID=92724 RepID=UPI003CC9F241